MEVTHNAGTLKIAWKICYAVQFTDCARCCEKVSSYLQIFFYEENKHLIFFFFFFFLRSVISLAPPFPPSSSLISLFLSSRSTLSASSSLSVAQKWLGLADSTDKRLNACSPQRRRRRREEEGRKNRAIAEKDGETEKECE